jgi:hypothetical protein
MSSSFKISLISQEVSPLAPRKSIAKAVVAENGEKTKLVDDQAEFFIRFLKMSNPKSLLMSMKDLSSSVKSLLVDSNPL